MSPRKNGFPKALASRLATLLAPLALCAGLLASAPASAASLLPVTGWQNGTEPSWVSAYEYAPDNLPANAPVIVLVHYCSGNASGIFSQAQGGGSSSIVAAADAKKILLVVPQTSRNCWDVATTQSLTHNGTNNDMKAIVDQTKYAITRHSANANRVYVMGASSGAMVTQVLLAAYPDVFKGGAEFAGVPAGCWAVNYTESNQWSSPCAGGQVVHTPMEWGDIARNMFPGYTGFRPRIQLWHGSADPTINYTNYTEAVEQWTNVLGLPTAPTMTGTLTIGGNNYNRRQWKDSCGITVLDAFDQPNGPHGPSANMNGQYTIPFFNLDQATLTATDPQAAGCGATGTGGAGGSTGTGGRGGTTGTGGSTGGRGGTTGTGGTVAAGGRGGTTGAGGTTGVGGTTGAGGTSATGTAGTSGAAGDTGSGTGGDSSSGAAGDTGSGSAGTTGAGNTGGDSLSGAAGDTGSGSAGTTGGTGPMDPGCACETAHAPGAVNASAVVGLLAVAFLRRRRAKRSARER